MRRAAAELQKRTEALELNVREEREALERARELRDALETRYNTLLKRKEHQDDADAMSDERRTNESELDSQRRRNDELRAENTKLKRALLKFLNKCYPRPNPESTRQNDDRESSQMKTLREIVQMLMNRYISTTNPKQRYIRLESDIWGPYIELLLRSGVAEKNPNDSTLIRLSDFCIDI